MPAGVTGIGGRREAHRERAERRPRPPALAPDQLVEGVVEHRGVGRGDERRLAELIEPDHRPRPGRRVVRIAAGGAPEDRAGLIGHLAREGVIDADEAVADEILDVRVAERAGAIVVGSHEKILRSRRPAAPRACGGRQFSRGRGAPGSKRRASNDLEEGRSDREHHHAALTVAEPPRRCKPAASIA
nr:hypothetical protein [Nannocystis exedens]